MCKNTLSSIFQLFVLRIKWILFKKKPNIFQWDPGWTKQMTLAGWERERRHQWQQSRTHKHTLINKWFPCEGKKSNRNQRAAPLPLMREDEDDEDTTPTYLTEKSQKLGCAPYSPHTRRDWESIYSQIMWGRSSVYSAPRLQEHQSRRWL